MMCNNFPTFKDKSVGFPPLRFTKCFKKARKIDGNGNNITYGYVPQCRVTSITFYIKKRISICKSRKTCLCFFPISQTIMCKISGTKYNFHNILHMIAALVRIKSVNSSLQPYQLLKAANMSAMFYKFIFTTKKINIYIFI